MSQRIEGIVAWFSSAGQSWGSIDYGDGCRVFVHYKNILPDNQPDQKYRTLTAGQAVEFEIAEGHRGNGTQAVNVRVLLRG